MPALIISSTSILPVLRYETILNIFTICSKYDVLLKTKGNNMNTLLLCKLGLSVTLGAILAGDGQASDVWLQSSTVLVNSMISTILAQFGLRSHYSGTVPVNTKESNSR
jgi:hypothetical protein